MDLTNQRLLVIAPHTDDEIIGCGGLIQKIKKGDGEVFILYLTNGDTVDFSSDKFSSSNDRITELKQVIDLLEIDGYDIALPGNENHLRLDTLGQSALMNIIERKSSVSIENIKPTILAFPSITSYNQDHRIAAFAAHASSRPGERDSKHFIPLVISYEQAAEGWTLNQKEHLNTSISLTREELDLKIKALNLYTSQRRNFPNPRSEETIRNIARLRGSQNGCEYAECFTAYRIAL